MDEPLVAMPAEEILQIKSMHLEENNLRKVVYPVKSVKHILKI